LQSLAESLGAASSVIRTTAVPNIFARRHDNHHGPDSTGHFEFSKLWFERTSSACDPRFSFRNRLSTGTRVIVEDEFISSEMRARDPFYNEVARPGCREWMAVVFFRVDGQTWSLPLFRDARRGRFQVSEKPRLASIIPYLERAVLTAGRVADAVASGTLDALDRMSSRAMIIDDRGIVLKLNSMAEAMLGYELKIIGGRLHASDRGSERALEKLLAYASAGFFAHAPAAIVFRDNQPWLRVNATPLYGPGNDVFGAGRAILHFDAIAPATRHEPELLQQAFGLTPAEARLALLLAKGGGLAAAAATLNIGRETARTQLRAVFAKTGTGRQAELAAYLTNILNMSAH
jgi:DNA-binding CsgD family transcriptional regulator/PAS domain-containing protein